MLFDQHFLIDSEAINIMIERAELQFEDVVLEVGPGKGFITKELAKKVRKVYAIEIDRYFEKYLDGMPKNVEIIYDNVLNKIKDIECNKVVANIPFSISEPFFKKLIKTKIERAILIISNGFFTVLTNKKSKWHEIGSLFFDIGKVLELKKEVFEPRPRVTATLVLLKRRKKRLTKKERLLKEFVLQYDKKVKNGLKCSLMRCKNYTKKEAKTYVTKLKIPERLLEKSVDHLSNRQFYTVYNKL